MFVGLLDSRAEKSISLHPYLQESFWKKRHRSTQYLMCSFTHSFSRSLLITYYMLDKSLANYASLLLTMS